MTRDGIKALAAELRYFRYHPWEWSNADSLSLTVELDDEAQLRAALESLGLSWPADWIGEPHTYDIERDCACDVGRHYLEFSIANLLGRDEGLERSHVETALRIEASLERAGILPLGRFAELGATALMAQLERAWSEVSADEWSRTRLHLRLSRHRPRALHVLCAVACGYDPREGPPPQGGFTASVVEEPVHELEIPPGCLGLVCDWVLEKKLKEPPWVVVSDLGPDWQARSFDERLERALALFDQPRMTGIEIGLIQPQSKAGWHPRRPLSERATGRPGRLSLVARWTVGAANVLAILWHDVGMTEHEFEDKAPRAQGWAAQTAKRLGVPCTVPITPEVDPFLKP